MSSKGKGGNDVDIYYAGDQNDCIEWRQKHIPLLKGNGHGP